MTDPDYRALCDQLPGAVVISDSVTGQILDCNGAAESLTGRSRGEMVGIHHAALLATSNAVNTHADFLDFAKNGHAASYRTEILTKRGESVPVVINASHVKVGGKDAVIQRVFTFTSEDAIPAAHSTMAEDNLRTLLATGQDMIVMADRDFNVEEHFRALIENSPDVITILNGDGTIRCETPSVEQVLGYKPEELAGKSVFDLLHPDDAPRAIDSFGKLWNSPGATQPSEMRYLHKDGSWRWMEGIGKNLLHDPKIRGIVVNYRDITERKRLEEALQRSESRHRLITENVPDVIWTMDMNLRFTYISPSVWRQQGITVEEAMQRRPEDFLSPASLEAAMNALNAELAREEDESGDTLRSWTVQLEQYCGDGSTIWTEVAMTFLRDDDGRAVGILGVTRDIR